MKRCAKCGTDKALTEFSSDKYRKDKLRCRCRSCENEDQREARRANPELAREKSRLRAAQWRAAQPEMKIAGINRWNARHPEKIRAQRALHNAIEHGRIVRPDHCSWCRERCKPQAHHPDYNKPLDVIWLCVLCHRSEHRGTPRVFIPEGLAELIQTVA